MSKTPPIMAGTIRNQVYQFLKHEICGGSYQPGQRLQEVDLAQQLKVSRSPVREALRQLVFDGLLTEVPNKGVFVKEFRKKDMEEIFDIRWMMESYAVLHARPELIQAHREALMDTLGAMQACHGRGDLNGYITLDNKLHRLFVVISGNDLLLDSYQRIDTIIQQFRIYSLIGQQRFDESVDEHRGVVHCILTGALEEANQINYRHLTLAKEKIVEHITRTQ